MGGIDDEPPRKAELAGKLGEDAVENAHAAPADEAVVQRLVRAVVLGRASRQRNPFLMTNTIPLITFRSSARWAPRDSGK